MTGEYDPISRQETNSYQPHLRPHFRIPPLAKDHISRSHLLTSLYNIWNYRLVLLCAPAGYGKTSLVAEFAQAQNRVVWLSLSSEDNDIPRFWNAVVTALRLLKPDFATYAEKILKAYGTLASDIQLLRLLVEELAGLEDAALVLDRLDVIQRRSIHEGIAFLIDNLPPPIHLCITTRSEPSLGLARLRASGQLLELREADLRFSEVESQVFLRHQVSPALADNDIQFITDRTEGWPAGLRLAALHLNTSGVMDVAQATHGSHPDFIDYFQEEVLRYQPERVRQFLLETSLLAPLEVDAASFVTRMSDARELLAEIVREHCFIHVLEGRQEQYRYHPLFAEALQSLLDYEAPEVVTRLHHRAAHWYAKSNDLETAIEHALAAGTYIRAIQWIGQVAKGLLIEGEIARLRRWLDQLPSSTLHTSVRLQLTDAWTRVLEGHWELLEGKLNGIEKQIHSSYDTVESASLLGEVLTLRAELARLHLDLQQTYLYAQQAL